MTDKAFANNYQEGELWEGATVFRGEYPGFIPHEPNNNFIWNEFARSAEPENEIVLGPGTDSYIKY